MQYAGHVTTWCYCSIVLTEAPDKQLDGLNTTTAATADACGATAVVLLQKFWVPSWCAVCTLLQPTIQQQAVAAEALGTEDTAASAGQVAVACQAACVGVWSAVMKAKVTVMMYNTAYHDADCEHVTNTGGFMRCYKCVAAQLYADTVTMNVACRLKWQICCYA